MKNQLQHSNQHLIEECKLGNRKAQYALYQQYVDAMFNVCQRIVNSREDAEDVLQESFLSAFKNINSFRFDSTFGAWLKRIVINKSITFIKKKKLNLIDMEEEKVNKIAIKTDDTNFFQDLSGKAEKVKTAIKQLPNGARTVLNLYLFEGYDHLEIGEILNISESTSKSQYSRAKQSLRTILTKM